MSLTDAYPTSTTFTPSNDVSIARGDVAASAIDRLENTELHRRVLDRLREMLKMSSQKMATFHDRWRANEHRYQAYLGSKELEQLRKASNQRGTPPELITITVPYTYSTVMTICTYLLQAFCGRTPIFQTDTYRGDMVSKARKLESVLQYNADHEKLIRKLHQFFLDGEMYGLQVIRTLWKVEQGVRTKWKPGSVSILTPGAQAMQPVKEELVVFEGNEPVNIDPFQFFPDPRVPMEEVSRRGEFVFWRTYESKLTLKKAERNGMVKYVDKVQEMSTSTSSSSDRKSLADGSEVSERASSYLFGRNLYRLDQGTVDLIPSEWGLGDSDYPEKWIFTVANDSQIIQAEPFDSDHDEHPVIVGEPYSTGYGFGNFSSADLLGPMQDMISWMLNSHIFNVRAVLNNTLVVNPQMVDMSDFKRAGPGRVIKMLPAAFGQDPKNAVYQLPVQDITARHITDMQIVQRLADMVSSVNDNMRGIQAPGGRKTATEVRTSGESGVSRLAMHARLVSTQSIIPLATVWTLNIQEKLSQRTYVNIVGMEGMKEPIAVGPDELSGDYKFPVHDGTLPLDRVGLFDIWKEILLAILQNPGLIKAFNAVGIFEYVAELGGARNITQFRIQTAGNDQIAAAVAAGNQVPAGAPSGLQ